MLAELFIKALKVHIKLHKERGLLSSDDALNL